MRLAVNIDHFATLREARKATEPEPVLVALLAEQAGAHGIVCHIRATGATSKSGTCGSCGKRSRRSSTWRWPRRRR
jgi:hypothetical protein